MKSFLRRRSVKLAGLIVGVTVMATGIAFAALQAQAMMNESTIESTTASLKLWDGDSYETTVPGFKIQGLVPGSGSAEKPFYIKNDGGVPLNVALQGVSVPPTTGFNGLMNVKVTITGKSCNQSVTTDLESLINLGITLPCNPIAVGVAGDPSSATAAGNYSAKFDIDPAAIFGSTASVAAFNVTFTGTQVIAGE